ncbi:hypothetical protein SODALDRAFT_320152 [Sodiomyces alkalinus F11]|uniref:Uncharacterized protein n=1 Tax=Sodiomyces alkalinus (strain CBS 110278 / VKM F-3762 / F11) TaxID=1314773 RepID=A0A3N2QAM2_SODAK|nr:hypothetical protein SODALDRAFT_320152 [Sodiomyces alkalinus F11]ROT43767.1 hypothetical protein SODALDRAFT_320152 [Sodiomyces alkalinus F11]
MLRWVCARSPWLAIRLLASRSPSPWRKFRLLKARSSAGTVVCSLPSAAELAAEARRSSQVVWAEGVDHGDEHGANQLWNDERRRVMLVDFDRATLLPALKHKQLFKLSGKKRKWQGDGPGNYEQEASMYTPIVGIVMLNPC